MRLHLERRLPTDGATATIGDETRPVLGAVPQVILDKNVTATADLPSELEVPSTMASADSIFLKYDLWRSAPRSGPLAARRTELLSASSEEGGATLKPRRLAELGNLLPGRLIVTAYESSGRRPTVHEIPVEVPKATVLRLGYSLRLEGRRQDAYATRFVASLELASGESFALLDQTLGPRSQRSSRWVDETVDLAALAGRRGVLRLRTEPASERGAFSLPVWSQPALYQQRRGTLRRNVMLVSIDTLRAENLGTYGYERATSPFLDSVAAGGVVFVNAITAATVTAASHMSLFTGLYPPRHGIMGGGENKRAGVSTLATLLHDAGYRTMAFTEDGYLLRDRGFGEGFDRYKENRGKSLPSAPAPGYVRETFDMAINWLETEAAMPFFLFVHTYQVHGPYNPPAAYGQLFTDDGVPGPADPHLRLARDNYDREIRYVDDQLRSLVHILRQNGLAESTILVILADHGEEFGEHGFLFHGSTVYDDALRVPLIFSGAGIPPGRRVAQQVSLIDVTPTVLDLLSIAIPPALDGRSLADVIRDEAPVPKRALFAEAPVGRGQRAGKKPLTWKPPIIAVRYDDDKYVVHRPPQGAATPAVKYGLQRDPHEQTPEPVAASELKTIDALVDSYLAGAAVEGQGGVPSGAALERIDPETREKLRQLGYID